MISALRVLTALRDREDVIARMRAAYGFSVQEARDFIDFCAKNPVEKPVEHAVDSRGAEEAQ